MRCYWCVEGTLGILLALAPFVEHAGWSARYTDLAFGVLFVGWALVGHLLLGHRIFRKAGG